jgi:hypothetical protein
MPGGDRTGPWGYGPRTGRSLGYCAGLPTPGYTTPRYDRRLGRGRGRGFGRGSWGRSRGYWWRDTYPYLLGYNPEMYPEPSREDEKAYLEDVVKGLEEELKTVRERLQELLKEKKETQK